MQNMAVAMRTNGLHHAVSLGNIQTPNKPIYSSRHDRNYDSEDENMSRRRLRHTSSSELFPRASVYSKGDIREQYCLTDRQLNIIERPRSRDRFFGCLSRRSVGPQTFLGGCVGRRVPSDENLASYAPYPRNQHKGTDADMDGSYFRRQPASILSSARMQPNSGSATADVAVGNVSAGVSRWVTQQHHPYQQQQLQQQQQQQQQKQQQMNLSNINAQNENLNANANANKYSSTEESAYHYPTHIGVQIGPAQIIQAPTTPRTKHVSFARSHTLTSFDDVNNGLRSSGRLKSAQSQERLLGGKKPIIATGSLFDPTQQQQQHQQQQPPQALTQHIIPAQAFLGTATPLAALHHGQHPLQILQTQPQQQGQPGALGTTQVHIHPAHTLPPHVHGHSHQHHHMPLHIHQFVPTAFNTELLGKVQTEQPMTMGLNVIACPTQPLAPSSPEVVVVEKKFRNAMKTQATQTDQRKEAFAASSLTLSPRTVHRVRVVSQGAQTNGLQNGKKLAKSLSEMPHSIHSGDSTGIALKRDAYDHDSIFRTQSEEPTGLGNFQSQVDDENNINYYKPPAPPSSNYRHGTRFSSEEHDSSVQSVSTETHEAYAAGLPIDYESNSLPRRSCSHHRQLDNEYSSHSLPRREHAHSHDVCKHITECSELRGEPSVVDFSTPHLLPPPKQYRKTNDDDEVDDDEEDDDVDEEIEEEADDEEQVTSSAHDVKVFDETARRKSMGAILMQVEQVNDTPFRRDDFRRQSMPIFVKTERLIDGYAPRSSFRSRDRIRNRLTKDLSEEKEIFIDFKPHISPKPSPKIHQKYKKIQRALAEGLRKQAAARNLQQAIPMRSTAQVAMQGDEECESCASEERQEEEVTDSDRPCDDHMADDVEEGEDHLYENVPPSSGTCVCGYTDAAQQTTSTLERNKREQFRKRSVSLEESGVEVEQGNIISAPPSPCRDDGFPDASTYPSSDSLANDATRDHSDGIWNESQVTVLTAENKDSGDPTYANMNLLLTPNSKRRNLLLQHQQRSSVDTDALDYEDQLTDHSPTYSNISSIKTYKSTATGTTPSPSQQSLNSRDFKDFKPNLTAPQNFVTPSIAVTPSLSQSEESPKVQEVPQIQLRPQGPPSRSPSTSRRSSAVSSYSMTSPPEKHKIFDASSSYLTRVDAVNNNSRFNQTNTDISECSTNTDEYATCTDTSKRTPGIKTSPTATSSSSTTQVPVSTHSSQMDKSHGGSSFESASSLYSSRVDMLTEDAPQQDEKSSLKTKTDVRLSSPAHISEIAKSKSPSHSISSTSSGSFNPGVPPAVTLPQREPGLAPSPASSSTITSQTHTTAASVMMKDKPKPRPDSISDDERSEMRYSSSGYYESPPHDDIETNMLRSRRHRLEEERKRRKTSMKLDIERENMRALASPIRKPAGSIATMTVVKDKSPEQQIASSQQVTDAQSPSKARRFRPKIRRQLRRTSRDESSTRRGGGKGVVYAPPTPGAGNTEKLLDYSLTVSAATTPAGATATTATTVTTAPSASSLASSSKDIEEDLLTTEVKVKPSVPTSSAAPPTTVVMTAFKCASEGAATVTCSSGGQLKAKSIESLRSVSPGSDSVFYSEADGTCGDQHSHCQHCGKEVEGQSSVVSFIGGDSAESIPYIENDQEPEQNIVKPPSDFADSPVTTKTTQRLYKKMDKRFRSEERYHGERGRHYKTRQENIRAKSEERNREHSMRNVSVLRPAGSSPCVLPEVNYEQNQQIIYCGHYDAGRYTRLTDSDVWTQLDHESFDRQRGRRDSTDSERSFHSKYQVILHRLVQRRCTLEMYQRQKNNKFQLIASGSTQDSLRRKLEEILKLMLLVWARESYVLNRITHGRAGVDKTVVVKSDSGEFGFRIHGSKPVVVAAIEPETPAESSGLEVGDIIISVNGVQVLDKHHTEVVKIAHDGCEKLELQVARTIGILMNEQQEPAVEPIFSGYLWRQSGQAKGTPNIKKWVRRWFCLRPDNCLYYYKTDEDSQPVGAMIMAKHTVEACPPEIGKPFAFKVDSGEGIPLYVASDSEELTNRWINLLKQAASQTNNWLDNCARYLYQQPSCIQRPDCFGYLMKLGSRWCGWSKRYCVLKDACLYFYQDANSKSAFGMACLHGYKVATMSTNASGKKNAFEVIPPESKLRHYYFYTETEMDKKRWISALEYSIDRWIKSG